MTIHTANWHLTDAAMSCGHTLALRANEHSGFCPWCAATVSVARAA